MITKQMKELLEQIASLCYKASEEVFETEETKKILNCCDNLQEMIDDYLKI